MPVTHESRMRACKRAGKQARQRVALMIEGEAMTIADIAKRTGLTYDIAAKRLRREQGKPGAVTLKGLAGDC